MLSFKFSRVEAVVPGLPLVGASRRRWLCRQSLQVMQRGSGSQASQLQVCRFEACCISGSHFVLWGVAGHYGHLGILKLPSFCGLRLDSLLTRRAQSRVHSFSCALNVDCLDQPL